MRKIIVFILAGAMFAGGLYVVGGEVLFASKVYVRAVAGGVLLILFGGYLLWADFVAPALNIRTWED